MSEQSFDPKVLEFMQQARDAVAKGDWAKAKEAASAVLAFEPGNSLATSILVAEFVQQARDAVDKGQWQQARECALKVMAFEPGNAMAGSILRAADQLPKPPDPQSVDEMLSQAKEQLRRGEWERAGERARAVLAMDPHNPEAERILAGPGSMPALEDPQTGKMYRVDYEDRFATIVASVAFAYLIVALVLLILNAVDTLLSAHTLLSGILGYDNDELLNSEGYKLLALTATAGGIGATLDAIRSMIRWHSEAHAYGPRFIWRDIAMPFVGGTIGVMAYVVAKTGAGLFSNDFSLSEDTSGPALLSALTVGFLAGFSSVQVYKWLDAIADRIFSTKREQTVAPAASQLATTETVASP